MKLYCNGNDLADAVGKVFRAVSTRTTNPILEGIKLSAERGTLTLSATDLEIAIEKCIPADVEAEGEIVVPGKIFSDFVKKLTHERIELVLDGSRLKIKYTESEGVLQCLPAEDFPPLQELAEAQSFVILKCEFKDLVGKVAFAVGQDDSRPMLKGVLLEISDVSVTGVASDGYRLARCIKPVEKTTAMMTAVVPARCITEMARLVEDTADPLTVNIQKNYMLIDLGHTKVTTRLLDGDFINYKQIIPYDFNTTVTVPKEQFEDALERAILLARAEGSSLVKFDVRENIMLLSANSEAGNVNEKIPVSLKGVDITIAFNARYFAEMLKFMDSDAIILSFTNSVSPCTVSPVGSTDDYLYLVLPVRIFGN